MELNVILGVLLALAILVAIFMFLQNARARDEATRATGDIDAVRKRLGELETESRKNTEALEAKRRESDELKERLKDVKKRRHEEKESARLKKDIEIAREEIEREMEKKLAVAREEAELSKSQVKKLSMEMEALRSRRSAPEPRPEPTQAKPVIDTRPLEPRYATPEEVKRAEEAEKAAVIARRKVEEAHEEVKKVRARAETDRRVFLVQKGEVEVAKDKFRAMEAKANALVLERDELKKAVWLLEKEFKSLKPTAEVAKAPKPAAAPAPAAEVKPVEAKPAEPTAAEAKKPEETAKA
jgi:DNA repair exonuclease SbcCD ATPase subunit